MSPMTRSRVPFGISSASPPVRLTKSRTHSAARRRSPWCAGSALTDGMAMNSRSSASQVSFTAGERAEDLAQRLLAHRDLGLLVRQRQVLVRDEVAELRLVLVAHRLLERDRRLRAAADVLDLLGAELEVLADLRGARLAAEL